jgi:hypothetical protein
VAIPENYEAEPHPGNTEWGSLPRVHRIRVRLTIDGRRFTWAEVDPGTEAMPGIGHLIDADGNVVAVCSLELTNEVFTVARAEVITPTP